MAQHKIIDSIDVYVKSRSVLIGEPCEGGVVIENASNYTAPARVDLQLPVDVVDYYRVFPNPSVSDSLTADIAANGIKNPLRIYTNGKQGVLRDGHHRLVVAKQLEMVTMDVHIVPNWLERTYIDYDLPPVEPILAEWLRDNLDFTHQGHQQRRTELNRRVTEAFCDCGAYWRENVREPWEHIMGAPKR